MHSVAQILDEKGRDIWSIGPDDQVYDAIKLMAEKGVGALLVTDGPRLAGVVSERDYARKVILQGRSSKSTPVRDIMSTNVITVNSHKTLDQCLAIMTEKRIRHLPVVEDGQILGVLSIGDLVKRKIADQEHLIESLEQYITQGG
ncbi:MAG: CBS domain-containing protein [Xanthomonadales bacterium]|nr:CBS domain-containing protein [Xanthomonadales bacterium]